MPQLGLGTDINRGTGGVTDPDALAYFATAGIGSGAVTPTAYDNASSFNGVNQYLSVASNSTLESGGTSFSISAWVLLNNNTSGQIFVGKDSVTGREYNLSYYLSNGSINRFSFIASASLANEVVASSFGQPNTGQWYHLVGTYDGTNQKIYVNGNLQGTAASAAPASTSAPFTIGQRNYTGYNYFLNGNISGVGFWKRALSATDITSLYNNGEGLPYSALDSSLKTSLVSWWALNETSGNRADSHGSNTLTNTYTVGTGSGPIVLARASSRQLINSFVKGVKVLGLWSSMVCWPLRSGQNANGTTAFSLGGLGTFNGTLSSSGALPTWGANGMAFSSASSTSINISNNAIFAPQSTTWGAMAVSNQTSMPGGYGGLFGKNNINDVLADIGWNLREVNTNFQPQISNGTTQALYNITSVGFNSFRSSMVSYDNVNVTGRVNGGTAVSSAYAANVQQLSNQTLRIGSGPTGATSNYFNGQIAFALFGYFSAGQQVALHSLYRQTLGLGLGLP